MGKPLSKQIIDILEHEPLSPIEILQKLNPAPMNKSKVENNLHVTLFRLKKGREIKQLQNGKYASINYTEPSDIEKAYRELKTVLRRNITMDDISSKLGVSPDDKNFIDGCWKLSQKLQEEKVTWQPRRKFQGEHGIYDDLIQID